MVPRSNQISECSSLAYNNKRRPLNVETKTWSIVEKYTQERVLSPSHYRYSALKNPSKIDDRNLNNDSRPNHNYHSIRRMKKIENLNTIQQSPPSRIQESLYSKYKNTNPRQVKQINQISYACRSCRNVIHQANDLMGCDRNSISYQNNMAEDFTEDHNFGLIINQIGKNTKLKIRLNELQSYNEYIKDGINDKDCLFHPVE